jgi:PAS domain S-box-containing protein
MPVETTAAAARVNILLVDDQPANLLALEAILDSPRHELVRASSGEQALARLQERDFAVVLLDVQMPGLDGFETANRIRSAEQSRQTPIIFLTAYEDDRFSAAQAYSLGAVDYLVKPLVPVILRAKVAGFVELFAKTEQIKRQGEELRRMERREFERRLDQENTRFRSIIENSYDAVVLIAADGTARYASPSITRIIGYRPEEFAGQNVFRWMHPDDLPATSQTFTELLQHPGASQETTFRYQHKNGSWRWIHGTGMNLLAEPSVQAIVGNFQDVTEERRLEQALRERAAELEEAGRRKDEFLAMLAHELRNPLAPIRNAVEVINRLGSSEPNLERCRAVIERQVNHMTRLVDDLLDVSRITRGKIQLEHQPVELANVVTRAVEASRPLIDPRRQQLSVVLPDEPLQVEGDATRLAQVVANLLNNAAKYTGEGGHIELAVERQGCQVVLRVRDDGMGIAADLLPRVFELFTQGDRSLARSEGGLGVGLTLVKELVERHRGRVEAFSDGPSRGSTFVVRLPLLECPPVPESREHAGRGAPCPPRRVLVVDDSRDAVESLSLLLKLEGHEIQSAHDGPAALEAARRFRPQVIFLDIGLPGMDGYQVASRLRQQPELDGALLVALTGYGHADDRRRAEAAGFHAHLVKPADPEVLHRLLARAKLP